jgi:acyl-CoA dehydrogenase
MVNFEFTEEQRLIRQTVHDWCKKNLPLETIRDMDRSGKPPPGLIKAMSDMGLIIITAPEEHGGIGADWITACLAAEELAYYDISCAIPVYFLLHSSWGFVVDRYASEEVRTKFVRPAMKGEGFIGIATTESGGGSDIGALRTVAKKEGNEWIINGEKMYISGTEEVQDLKGGYWITARTSPPPSPTATHKGITGFFVPIKSPGVEVAKRLVEVGRMGISTGGFAMENVRIPDSYRLGEEGKGFYGTMEGFEGARILIAATCLGAAQRVLEIGMDYVKQRRAFGQPIGKFEGIQFELANDWAELEASRALVYRTAWMIDEKFKHNKFSPLEVTKYISACKLKVPPLAMHIAEHVMIWMGAYGYSQECPIDMAWRGIMSYCVGAEGTLNIQRIIIGRELLGKDFIPYK